VIESPASLAAKGLIQPASIVWRVRFVFTDGSDRVVCVSPGRIDEERAVRRAKDYARIMDDAVVDRVEAEKVQRELQATPFGVVQK
tara:strand:+ start:2964 stop:3221 length:258 start_codon:yes stop_codon:yes gene_type:complete